MIPIDLIDLSKRESERIEWKENVADFDGLIKTAVAFANDFSNLGGGYIVCGAEETRDEHGFQKLKQIGLNANRLKEIENKVLSDLRNKVTPPIVPVIEEIPLKDDSSKRMLVLIISATRHAHSYRADGKSASTYYVRVGRETREARNGILQDLLVLKKQLDPWDKRVNEQSSPDDVDFFSLREILREMKLWDDSKAIEDVISDKEKLAEFVPTLAARNGLSKALHLRNFALLLFAESPLKYFYGAYTVVSIYPGVDRSTATAERHELTGNVVIQVKKVLQILSTQIYTVFDKRSQQPNQMKYPVRALKEALVNSIVHRDYSIDQPTRITVFRDRIEIYSPGSLPSAINPELFLKGKVTPFWRNQALAYFFNKLNLAQAEGQGIPTIFRTMKEEGCPAPIFELGTDSITCILPANLRHTKPKRQNARTPARRRK